jgi:hypothetical protein
MLRDNLAGLIEPMIDCAGAHAFGGHPKQEPTGGCSRSTELTIVVLKRSWRHVFRWKTGRRAENGKPPAFEVTTAAHDSRAVATAQHQTHRTIDPQCLKKSPPRRGGIYALTENVSSPFHAEPSYRFELLKASTSIARGNLEPNRGGSRTKVTCWPITGIAGNIRKLGPYAKCSVPSSSFRIAQKIPDREGATKQTYPASRRARLAR